MISIILLAATLTLPAPQEGQYWEFTAKAVDLISSSTAIPQGTYSATYRNGTLAVHQLENGQSSEVPRPIFEEISRMMGFGQDDRAYLKFPMDVGTKWTATWMHDSPGRRRPTQRSMEYQVKGTEQITVPAGTFEAYRIEGASSSTVEQKRIIHYSHNCACIVKFYYDSAVNQQGAKQEFQLLKYTSGK